MCELHPPVATSDVLQVAVQSSYATYPPETPVKQRASRPPSLAPVSLTFVPNPSGTGGILVPLAARPHRKPSSSSQSVLNTGFDSPSEQAASLESDSNTSSAVCLLPPATFKPSEPQPMEPSSPPFQPPCTPQKAELSPAQAAAPYSPISIKLGSPLTTPPLCQSDSCVNSTALGFETPAWSPNAAVQQLQAECSSKHFSSPLSGQLYQSRQYVPSPPSQSAYRLQFQADPSQNIQYSAPCGLSSPLLSGANSFSGASTGVPALAVGYPMTPDSSVTMPLGSYPHQGQQPDRNSTPASLDFAFDLPCQQLSSVASNLSMTHSTSSVCLPEPCITNPSSFDFMGLPQAAPLVGPPQTAPLLRSFSQHCLRENDPHSDGQTGSQTPFTFVPACCSSHSLCYGSAASLNQSMQSQVHSRALAMQC